MKDLKFEDVTANYEDQDGDTQEHTVRACVIDDDTAFVMATAQTDQGPVRVKVPREVLTRTGAVTVHPGDAIVETDRPGVYDVHDAESWKRTGYGQEEPVEVPAPDEPARQTGQSQQSTPGGQEADKPDHPTD